MRKKSSPLHDPALKRLVKHAYAKGFTDALVGSGAVFVPGIGLVSGLVGKEGIVHVMTKSESGLARLTQSRFGFSPLFLDPARSQRASHNLFRGLKRKSLKNA